MSDPPSESGVSKEKVTLPAVFVGDHDTDVTGPGVVAGVTLTEADAGLTPTAFTARSAIEYSVPLVRPETVTGDAVTAGLSAVHVGVASDGLSEYS